jgi:transcription-repair coupling factor (superfamily II helicase)
MQREVAKGRDTHVLVSGLYASARALVLAQMKEPLFVLLDDAEKAQYMYSDLSQVQSDNVQCTNVFFFPHSQKRRAVDEAAQIQRTECLTALTTNQSPLIIVTYPEAVAEPVPAKEELSAVSFQLKVGQEVQL